MLFAFFWRHLKILNIANPRKKKKQPRIHQQWWRKKAEERCCIGNGWQAAERQCSLFFFVWRRKEFAFVHSIQSLASSDGHDWRLFFLIYWKVILLQSNSSLFFFDLQTLSNNFFDWKNNVPIMTKNRGGTVKLLAQLVSYRDTLESQSILAVCRKANKFNFVWKKVFYQIKKRPLMLVSTVKNLFQNKFIIRASIHCLWWKIFEYQPKTSRSTLWRSTSILAWQTMSALKNKAFQNRPVIFLFWCISWKLSFEIFYTVHFCNYKHTRFYNLILNLFS